MADKEDTVRRGYQAFGEGDMEHFRAIYTPDVVQSQPGKNQTSGEHEGVDNVLGLYGKFFELSGGTFSVDLTSTPRKEARWIRHGTTWELSPRQG